MPKECMDDESGLPGIIETCVFESDAEEVDDYSGLVNEFRQNRERNRDIVQKFLGTGPLAVVSHRSPSYYSQFLSLTIKRVVSLSEWRKVSEYGNSFHQPVFIEIQTDYDKYETCLINGTTLISKDETNIAVTVFPGMVQLQAREQDSEAVNLLLREIKDSMIENNIYQGKRIILDEGQISFINVEARAWDSIVLDESLKRRIWENSIGFLKNIDKIKKYGISPRMGICLAGDPGTGKTVITRAIMAEAIDITCISTSPYSVLSGGYISELYDLAQDLSPSILCIEDIDSLGMERDAHYHGTPTYLALLQEMDGIKEKKPVVTIGTTNLLDTIDAALLRPPRFGCIIQLARPADDLRYQIIKNLSETIPVSDDIKRYIEKKTQGFTPAAIEGIIQGLAISHIVNGKEDKQFTTGDVDMVVSQVNPRITKSLGFNTT